MSAPRYLELFAGCGGLSRGLDAAGWACAGHAEIEPHARAVLRRHWPDTPLAGDVMDVRGADYADVSLVSFGAPCQDLSVAGKRAGLAGLRSSLFYQGIRLWEETGAPYALYENVLGALSSNGGADFAAIVSAFVGGTVPVPSDGWRGAGVVAGPDGVAAWRVLDLQWFGPPQRRRRVFVLGARAGGVDPAAVLLEPESVCRHPAPRRDTGEGSAHRAGERADAARGVIGFNTKEPGGAPSFGIAATLRAENGDPHMTGRSAVLSFAENQRGELRTAGVVPSLSQGGGKPDTGFPAVLALDTYNQTTGDVTHSLRDTHGTFGDALPAVLAFDWQNSASMGMECRSESDDSLRTSAVPAVFACDIADSLTVGANQMTGFVGDVIAHGYCAPPLTARSGKGPDSDANGVIVPTMVSNGDAGRGFRDAHGQAVSVGVPRRLMPIECERLMGWPDHWTAEGVREDGTRYRLGDAARYKLCGNGVGSPCSEWIGARLRAAVDGAA